MGWGKNIAVGCFVFIIIIIVAIIIGVKLFLAPLADSIGNVSGKGGEVGKILAQLSEDYPFNAGKNVFSQDRFLQFLQARQVGYDILKNFSETTIKKEKPDIKDVLSLLKMIGDVRLAHAKYLAQIQMSMAEYQWYATIITHFVLINAIDQQDQKFEKIFSTHVIQESFSQFERVFAKYPVDKKQKEELFQVKARLDDALDNINNKRQLINSTLKVLDNNKIDLIKNSKEDILRTFIMIYLGL